MTEYKFENQDWWPKDFFHDARDEAIKPGLMHWEKLGKSMEELKKKYFEMRNVLHD